MHKSILLNEEGTGTVAPGNVVQFDNVTKSRGRSRYKNDRVEETDLNSPTTTTTTNNTNASMNTGRAMSRTSSGSRSLASTGTTMSMSMSRSRSRSRSRSQTAMRVKDEEFLHWTVLRRDPSMRLRKLKKSKGKGKNKSKSKGTLEDTFEDDDDDEDEEEKSEDKDEDDDEDEDDEDYDDEDEEDEEEDDMNEESDEEQVSDVEGDLGDEFDYDLGNKVLPNFSVSLFEVLESAKPWVEQYQKDHQDDSSNCKVDKVESDFIRAVEVITKQRDNETTQETSTQHADSYILYMDLTSESFYALTYVLGCLLKDNDTLYIVHWQGSDPQRTVTPQQLQNNIARIKERVMHLLDCMSATTQQVQVVVLSLTHPYPKHLLNEMINGLQPLALCCALNITLTTLQNFVCSVPTFVIRKKLKRSKKKTILD